METWGAEWWCVGMEVILGGYCGVGDHAIGTSWLNGDFYCGWVIKGHKGRDDELRGVKGYYIVMRCHEIMGPR